MYIVFHRYYCYKLHMLLDKSYTIHCLLQHISATELYSIDLFDNVGQPIGSRLLVRNTP